jgi:hypothetical protein
MSWGGGKWWGEGGRREGKGKGEGEGERERGERGIEFGDR